MDRQHGKLKKLDTLLQDTSRRLGIDAKIKELMIMEYWKEIVKGNIAKDCKPYSLYRTSKGNVLNIAAKSSIVASELNMIKMMLIDKMNQLSNKIGVTINDMVVSTRYWAEMEHEEAYNNKIMNDDYEEELLTKEEIDNIKLENHELIEIEKMLQSIKDNEKLKENLKKIIIADLKIKKGRILKGYPLCKSCGVVLYRKSIDRCSACEYL